MNDNVDPRTGVHRVRKKRAKSSIVHPQPSHEEPPPPQDQPHEQPADSPNQMSMAFGTPVDIPFTMFNHNAAQMSDAVLEDMKRRDEHNHYE